MTATYKRSSVSRNLNSAGDEDALTTQGWFFAVCIIGGLLALGTCVCILKFGIRGLKRRVLLCKDDYCRAPDCVKLRHGKIAAAFLTLGVVLVGVGGFLVPQIIVPAGFDARWGADMRPPGTEADEWGCQDQARGVCKRERTDETYWSEFEPEADKKTLQFIYGADTAERLEPRSAVFAYYVWHVRNPREVYVDGAVPQLEQRGPFVYRRIAERTEVLIFEQENWLSYKENSYLKPMRTEADEQNELIRLRMDNTAKIGATAAGSTGNMNNNATIVPTPCTIFWAQMRNQAGLGEKAINSSEAATSCQDDTQHVVALNAQFLRLASNCPWGAAGSNDVVGRGRCSLLTSQQHLVGRMAVEAWRQQTKLLTEDMVLLLRVHRAPRMLAAGMRNLRMMKAPLVLKQVLRSIASSSRLPKYQAFRANPISQSNYQCGTVNVSIGTLDSQDPTAQVDSDFGADRWMNAEHNAVASMALGEAIVDPNSNERDLTDKWYSGDGGWGGFNHVKTASSNLCRLSIKPRCSAIQIAVAGNGPDTDGSNDVVNDALDKAKQSCVDTVKQVRILCDKITAERGSLDVCDSALISLAQSKLVLDDSAIPTFPPNLPDMPDQALSDRRGEGSIFAPNKNAYRLWLSAAAYRNSAAGGGGGYGPGAIQGAEAPRPAGRRKDYDAVARVMCEAAKLDYAGKKDHKKLCELQTDLVLHSVFGAIRVDGRVGTDEPDDAVVRKAAPFALVPAWSWAEHPLTHESVALDIAHSRDRDFAASAAGDRQNVAKQRRTACIWNWDPQIMRNTARDGTDEERCGLEFGPYAQFMNRSDAQILADKDQVPIDSINVGRISPVRDLQNPAQVLRRLFDAQPFELSPIRDAGTVLQEPDPKQSVEHTPLSLFYGADGFKPHEKPVITQTASGYIPPTPAPGASPIYVRWPGHRDTALGLREHWLPAFRACVNRRDGRESTCSAMGSSVQKLQKLAALARGADIRSRADFMTLGIDSIESLASDELTADDTLRNTYEAFVCTVALFVFDIAGMPQAAPSPNRRLGGTPTRILEPHGSPLAESAARGFAADMADVIAGMKQLELHRAPWPAVSPIPTLSVALEQHNLAELGFAQFGSGEVIRQAMNKGSIADVDGIAEFLKWREHGAQGELGVSDAELRVEFSAIARQHGWDELLSTDSLGNAPWAWRYTRTTGKRLLQTLAGLMASDTDRRHDTWDEWQNKPKSLRFAVEKAQEINAKLAGLATDITKQPQPKSTCKSSHSALSTKGLKAGPRKFWTLGMPSAVRDLLAVSMSRQAPASNDVVSTPDVAVGENCTRAAILAGAVATWTRSLLRSFACPGQGGKTSSCRYTHSGLFINVTARQLLLDGYTDPLASYLTRATVLDTDESPLFERGKSRGVTMAYRCHKARRFAAPPASEGSDATVSFGVHEATPPGWREATDQFCRPVEDLDCSNAGFEITLPESITFGQPHEPLIWDKDSRASVKQADIYFPIKNEWYLPRISVPFGIDTRIMLESGRLFQSEYIASPVYALFLGSALADPGAQKARTCARANQTENCRKETRQGLGEGDLLSKALRMHRCERDTDQAALQAPFSEHCRFKRSLGSNTLSELGQLFQVRDRLREDLGEAFTSGFQGRWRPRRWGAFEYFEDSEPRPLSYEMLDGLLDKDSDMGGALTLSLPFDGLFMQKYTAGDPRIGTSGLNLDVEIQMQRYCMTSQAWADARSKHNKSNDARGAAAMAAVEGHARPDAPVGMLDLEPSVGWPLVIGAPHFAGNVFWGDGDAASAFDFVHTPSPHRHHHNSCFYSEPISGRMFRMEQRMQWHVRIQRSPLFPKLHRENLYFPLIWGEKLFVIDAVDASEFQDDVLVTKGLVLLLAGMGFGFGFISLLIGTVMSVKANREFQQLLADAPPDYTFND